MVQGYGMNERIGQVSFPKDNDAYPGDRPYGNATAEVMDSEVRRVVEEAYQRTLDLVEAKKDQVKAVAELLLEKETISHIDVSALIGRRPFTTDKEYQEFLGSSWEDEPAVVDPVI